MLNIWGVYLVISREWRVVIKLMDSPVGECVLLACELSLWSVQTAWRGDAMLDSIRRLLAFIEVNVIFILSKNINLLA
jgi:hypothetical protein